MFNSKIYTDIISFNDNKQHNHIFSHIHNGKCLYPCATYRNIYNEDKSICYLYDGGLGMGNYIKIIFNKTTQQYYFEGYNSFNNLTTLLHKTKQWDEMYNYVCNYFLTNF
jgi:hypothetical protein